ncbi:fibronectin-binding protein A N-terminus-domain-containing protein [Xylariales sp. AK1849]|nr:fibronectin-binding protein A N-terminus-domain-containing protein [Xylariales sp. AK1849]
MKQRFSSLDVKVIAHELAAGLVSLRVSNIYDLSSKILLFKFAKPDNKKQLLIDSGFRCHLTDFARTTAAAPSVFVQKLRKVLKTRRLTAVSQIGTDRILEFQFSDGQYRLYLEFFASGNVILTDSELKILTLLRHVPEGEGQEPQRPGLTYSLENRQNYGGVPELTKERIRNALQTIVDRTAAAAASAAGKKGKKKPGDELRKGLATTITELPPILVDHAMKTNGFDSTSQPSAVLEDEELLAQLLRSLEEARKIVAGVTSSETCKGYIFAKKRTGLVDEGADKKEGRSRSSGLLYEDFHPFVPQQFQEGPEQTILTFDNYNKMVDEFFSSIEGQKLESKLTEREAAAKRKLEAAKADQAKRIEGLQETQLLNVRKAGAVEANAERVQEAMDAVNGLIAQGMDWIDIGKLIDRERKRNNPVAAIIGAPLKLDQNTITLLLGEAEADEDEDDAYETDSDESVSDGESEVSKQRAADKILKIDIDLGISPYANAREYYEEKKSAAVKEQKTVLQSEFALKNAEQKIAIELKKGLKQEKPLLQPVRRQSWFEKFIWFISSDGYLVLGGKDASQNEMLYRRYLKKGDIYVHADLHGAPSVIIKNNPQTPDAPIPPSTLSQAGSLSVCSSSAWDSKAGMSAWWVNADQVSKSAPTGEFLPTGSFMVRGKKNFLPPSQLLLGFGLMFRISEESKAKHVKHRLHDQNLEQLAGPSVDDRAEPATRASEDERSDSDYGESDPEDDAAADAHDQDHEQKENPLQSTAQDDKELDTVEEEDPAPMRQIKNLSIADTSTADNAEANQDEADGAEEQTDGEQEAETETGPTSAAPSGNPAPQSAPKKQAKRGQRGKAKKIAAKYRDQDDEDRAAIETLIGATAGQKKAEAEAQAKAEREAAQVAAKARRRAQHQRQQRETAEHEEVRKMMLEEGVETLDADEAEKTTPLDSLVGTPLVGDEILETVVMCAPYSAMGKLKYKAKLQPGTQKKGKAVKEILESWKIASTKKGVIDEKSEDKERMWPREVELIKALKPEETINAVPVSKLRVMGGGSGGGGDKGKGKGSGVRGKKK